MLIHECKHIYTQVINGALNVIASERLRVNLVSFTIRRRRTALFKKPIARRSSFDFERLMLLRVNSRYNRAARGQLFLRVQNWKISSFLFPPSLLRRVDTASVKGNGEKRSERGPCYYCVSTKGNLEPQEDETFSLPFFLFRSSYLALSSGNVSLHLSPSHPC